MDPSRLHLAIPLIVFVLCCLFRVSSTVETRIVGGQRINITDVPFMLSLRLNDDHICGAAVISQDWAVTAAHCVTTFEANIAQYSVRSGTALKDMGGEIHNITSIISHENFNDANNDNDIAVLKVDPPFQFDETTQPIDLPGDKYIDDDFAAAAGWGYFRKFKSILSKSLQYVIVPKVDRNECARDYITQYDITPRQVCYGYREGGKDACKGDSGGPLFTKDMIIIGITSWGDSCAEARLPGVYTTIFLMLDWIADKTGVRSTL